jgi:serine/threonine protein kinase
MGDWKRQTLLIDADNDGGTRPPILVKPSAPRSKYATVYSPPEGIPYGADTELMGSGDELLWEQSVKEAKTFPSLHELEEVNSKLEERKVRLAEKSFAGRYLKTPVFVGKGGFGMVFRAVRQSDSSEVALKIFTIVAGEALNDAQRELEMLLYLKHLGKDTCRRDLICYRAHFAIDLINDTAGTKVLTAMGLSITEPSGEPLSVFYVIETDFLDAKSMRKISFDEKFVGFSPYVNATLFLQIENALAFMHEHKAYHRDLKPDNVLVLNSASAMPSAVVIDVGGGCRIDIPATDDRGCRTPAGTNPYMTPGEWNREQAYKLRQGKTVVQFPEQYSPEQRASADLFALGATMYDWLSFHRRFRSSLTNTKVGGITNADLNGENGRLFYIAKLLTTVQPNQPGPDPAITNDKTVRIGLNSIVRDPTTSTKRPTKRGK